MVETEIETEEEKNAGGNRLGEAAVKVHRLVDPVTVAQVPDNAADVTKHCSLEAGKWISCLGVTEKCGQKRQKGDPAEDCAPEGRWSCDWERKNLKDSREYGQGP